MAVISYRNPQQDLVNHLKNSKMDAAPQHFLAHSLDAVSLCLCQFQIIYILLHFACVPVPVLVLVAAIISFDIFDVSFHLNFEIRS